LRILGIDPGSNITGYGIVDFIGKKITYVDSGCIKIQKISLIQKMHTLNKCITQLVSKYNIEHAAIEKAFVSKNIQSSLKLSQARGALISGLDYQSVELFEYSPTKVKLAIVGHGHAEKTMVNKLLLNILNIKGEMQQDASDALSIAVCHAFNV
jgi:crossover junction endodeoxyribonuclease RuvC